MFFFPYSTDAPIYHWPFTIVALIVVNVLVFVFEVSNPDQIDSLVLVFGDGYHPTQWVTNCFLHAGIGHLLGNMVFLWSFGIIVEGKLGWYKTLVLYLGAGLVYGAIVQSIMLGSAPSPSNAALGASGVIFALMAMTLVWAPENQIQCLLLLGIRPVLFDLKVITLVGLFLLFQIVVAVLNHMNMSSEVLHLVGAAIGLPLAIVMVKQRWVDCENWDLFSVWSGRHTMSEEDRAEAEKRTSAYRREQERKQDRKRDGALEQLRETIANGQLALAAKAHQHLQKKLPGWTLPEPDLSGLIRALHTEKLWSDSVPLMVEYVSQYPQKGTDLMRLKLAQILVIEQKRPAQALHVMTRIDPAALDPKQHEFFGRLRAKAAQLYKQNPAEAVEDWFPAASE